MTRRMFDSVTASHIPTSAAMVAGYVNGTWVWSDADWARFPNAVKVRIATRPDINDGHVIDVEPGATANAQAPGWVAMRRRAGCDPTVYCSELNLPAVQQAFRNAGVAQPHYWVARYNGKSAIPAGCVAKQYLWDNTPYYSGGHYDVSNVADYWPGVDKPKTTTAKPVVVPVTKKPKFEEDEMVLIYRDAKNVEHVALQSGGTMLGLSAGPANNAHVRAVTKGELPWLAVTITEWTKAWETHNKIVGA